MRASATSLAVIAMLMIGGPVMMGRPVTTPALAGQRCAVEALHGGVADRRATEEIRRRIGRDDTMSPQAQAVKVTTSNGVVTLRGPVRNDEERITIASLAESTPGVKRVDDRLEIRPR